VVQGSGLKDERTFLLWLSTQGNRPKLKGLPLNNLPVYCWRSKLALGTNFSVDQGIAGGAVTYPADPDATAFMTLLNNQILSFLQTNAAVITKAADIGDNII
jgi:hypothetical protein